MLRDRSSDTRPSYRAVGALCAVMEMAVAYRFGGRGSAHVGRWEAARRYRLYEGWRVHRYHGDGVRPVDRSFDNGRVTCNKPDRPSPNSYEPTQTQPNLDP